MFLATTALSEFWDKDDEIVFLGTWCLRHDRPGDLEGLRYRVMPSPWNDRRALYDATRYLDACYERMLKHLADYLNTIHRVSHSQRYWRILIGPWFLYYLHSVYDRHVHLQEAFRRYPGLRTIVLDPASFQVPGDTVVFMNFVLADPYNLQIFSELLKGLGYVFPAKVFEGGWPSPGNGVASDGPRIGVKAGTKLALEFFTRVRRRMSHIALCDMYWPRSSLWAFAWWSRLRALPLEITRGWSFTIPEPVFGRYRKDLAMLPYTDSFDRTLVQSLPQNVPTLFLEGYKLARNEILITYPVVPPAIASATGWYSNERFKFLASEAVERGTRLWTVQHGGGPGFVRFSSPELHESRLADSFMVWGWAYKDDGSFRNLPSPKLSLLLANQSGKSSSYRANAILFVATGLSRYLYRFDSMPAGSQCEEYFEWELRFLAAFSNRLRSAILFRAYPDNSQRANRERILKRFPDVGWDDNQLFYQTLTRSRMVVIDNLQTTFLEALVANVPTVVFWDPERWEVRDEAEPYFEGLRKAGILWDSPEAAASKVSEVYDRAWTWWSSEMVQEARRTFVDRYALAREDWVDCWVEALEGEIASSRVKGDNAGGRISLP